MGKRKHNGEQGSMTVEAVIALPAFLLLFMCMMYLVNVCNAYLALNHAVDQAAKYTANGVYVHTKIGEVLDTQDDWAEFNSKKEELISTIIEDMISGNRITEGYGPVEDLTKNFIRTKLKILLSDMAIGAIDSYMESASERMLMRLIEGSKIDAGRVEMTLYKLPKGALSGSESYEYQDYFGEEDIVIQARYSMKVELPLLKSFDFPIVSTCVEKGFTKGAREEYMTLKDSSFFERIKS